MLIYNTGQPTTQHLATFSRLATLFRDPVSQITHVTIFSRAVTIARSFTASISNTALRNGLLMILLPRIATTVHTARKTDKRVTLPRTAQTTHAALHRKALTLAARVASTVHQALFARAVTVRRDFIAQVTHAQRLIMALEARLIPREGGGGTVINVFRSLFVFDD